MEFPWKLNEVQTLQETKTGSVYAAVSEEFGPVVVKHNSDPWDLEPEYEMLEYLDGCASCRVYGYDEKKGLLLEERILPGTPLALEPSLEKRIDGFCSVFHRIHPQVGWGKSYLDWLDGIVKYCQMYCAGTELEKKALRAFYICVDLFGKYPSSHLLHGDLHHDNILLRRDGSYAIIDPKGVTGPEILDTPRFLLNELSRGQEDETHIRRCIHLLSRALGFPEEDLGKAFYMETVLANLWHMEDGEPVRWEELTLAEKFLP